VIALAGASAMPASMLLLLSRSLTASGYSVGLVYSMSVNADEFHTTLEVDKERQRILKTLPLFKEVWIRGRLLQAGSKAASIAIGPYESPDIIAGIAHRDIYIFGQDEYNKSAENERKIITP
jgi:hypothetical protein